MFKYCSFKNKNPIFYLFILLCVCVSLKTKGGLPVIWLLKIFFFQSLTNSTQPFKLIFWTHHQINIRNLLEFLVTCGECGSLKVERHCDFRITRLCVPCVGQHFSDSTHTHNDVPFILYKLRHTFIRCSIYSHLVRGVKRKWEHFCKKCNVPVCSTCV